MDRSYPSSRRLLQRARRHTRVALAGGISLLGAIGIGMLAWQPDPIAASIPAAYTATLALNAAPGGADAVERGVRRIYPYSVVPGGVASPAELQRVIRSDRVVAAHYANFDAGKARPVVVAEPRAVHVSYRKGDKVYWTAHKVMLNPGETLLSDGRNEMRARCANRISDLPRYPVEAHRPAMEELDQPIELADQDQFALVAMPAGMDAVAGMQQHAALRVALNQAGAASSANSALPATTLFDPASMRPVSTVNLLGYADGTGNSPVSEPGAPPPAPEADTGTSGGASSAPSPGGAVPGQELADAGPAPKPAPGPVTEAQPTLPGPAPVPPAPPAQPGPTPEPGQPKPEPLPPQSVVPTPVEVPEPGSLWLFVPALAAMGVLRRRRRA